MFKVELEFYLLELRKEFLEFNLGVLVVNLQLENARDDQAFVLNS